MSEGAGTDAVLRGIYQLQYSSRSLVVPEKNSKMNAISALGTSTMVIALHVLVMWHDFLRHLVSSVATLSSSCVSGGQEV